MFIYLLIKEGADKMQINPELLKKFREHVIELTNNKTFLHHEWYLEHHLKLVLKLALECQEKFYPHANRNLIELLVWLHDYGKIVDRKNKYQATYTIGKAKLIEIGFSENIVQRTIEMIKLIDQKTNLEKTPIEVKIVASADAASHLLYGEFYFLLWKDRPNLSLREMRRKHLEKLSTDQEKMVLSQFRENPKIKIRISSLYRCIADDPETIF